MSCELWHSIASVSLLWRPNHSTDYFLVGTPHPGYGRPDRGGSTEGVRGQRGCWKSRRFTAGNAGDISVCLSFPSFNCVVCSISDLCIPSGCVFYEPILRFKVRVRVRRLRRGLLSERVMDYDPAATLGQVM